MLDASCATCIPYLISFLPFTAKFLESSVYIHCLPFLPRLVPEATAGWLASSSPLHRNGIISRCPQYLHVAGANGHLTLVVLGARPFPMLLINAPGFPLHFSCLLPVVRVLLAFCLPLRSFADVFCFCSPCFHHGSRRGRGRDAEAQQEGALDGLARRPVEDGIWPCSFQNSSEESAGAFPRLQMEMKHKLEYQSSISCCVAWEGTPTSSGCRVDLSYLPGNLP